MADQLTKQPTGSPAIEQLLNELNDILVFMANLLLIN